TDAVDGTDAVTCLPVSGSTFVIGSTPVTCNAADAAGNAATPVTFNVVVTPESTPTPTPYYGGGYYGGGYSTPAPSPTPKPTQTPATPTPSIAPPAASPSPSPRPTMGHLALTIPTPKPSVLPLGEQPAAITGLFAFANSSCVGALLLLAIIASALAYYAAQKKKIVKAPLWIALAVMFLLPFAAALLLDDACQAVAYALGEDVILALLAFAVKKKML
ncbi:MAG: HYR domain-containing protein, partial [Candidatus Micrarchaeota archaeon]